MCGVGTRVGAHCSRSTWNQIGHHKRNMSSAQFVFIVLCLYWFKFCKPTCTKSFLIRQIRLHAQTKANNSTSLSVARVVSLNKFKPANKQNKKRNDKSRTQIKIKRPRSTRSPPTCKQNQTAHRHATRERAQQTWTRACTTGMCTLHTHCNMR